MRALTPAFSFLVAAFLVACGGSDDADAGGFPKAAADELRELVEQEVETYGWAAGCLWDQDSFEMASRLEAGYLVGVDRNVEFTSGAWRTAEKSSSISTVHLFAARSGLVAQGKLVDVTGEGYYCLRPDSIPK